MDFQNRNFPSKRHPRFGRGRYFSNEADSGQKSFSNWRQKREENFEESSDFKRDFQKPVKKQNYGPKHKEHAGGIKEWRLVVRNLDDFTKREELQELFSRYGKLREIVQIPSKIKKDGFAPFAFIQFISRNDAMKALETLNGSEFKKRKITVSLALDKDTYITRKHEAKEKEKKPKEEVLSDSDEDKIPQSSDEDTEIDFTDTKKQKDAKTPKERKPDTAVAEGRVLFLKNLPFELDDEELKEEMSKFGEVTLAILCKIKGTDHSMGTGFVHFKEKSTADEVLGKIESGEGLTMYGTKIRGHRAVPKNDAEQFKKPEKKPSDNRNLYLVRVSLIRPGTAAANNMSPHDEKKRASLLQQVKNKLKLTTMFVSPTRLAIHNIPFSIRDEELKKICMESCHNEKAKIVEYRVMRNKMGTDAKGKPVLGKSKGFGFVEFSEHKDALACLKKMNNNPDIFTDEKRPIVEFSIENHMALNLKKKRKEMLKHPKRSDKDVEETKNEVRKSGAKALPKKLGVKIRNKNPNNPKGRWTEKQKSKRKMNSEALQLLNELAEFPSDDPDADFEFVESLTKYYFPFSEDTLNEILKLIEEKKNGKGIDLLVALGLKVVDDGLMEIDVKSVERILDFYDSNCCSKTSTTKQIYFLLLRKMLDNGLIAEEQKKIYVDVCLDQLKDEKCNLFCRKELEGFLGRLLIVVKEDREMEKIVEAVLSCENGLILDGLVRVMLEPELKNIVAKKYSVKLLRKFEKIRKAEGNICDLAAYLLYVNFTTIEELKGSVMKFEDQYTRIQVVVKIAEVILDEFLKENERKEFYKLIERISGNEIDYRLPFIEKVFGREDKEENDEIVDILLDLAPELQSTKNCSSEGLIIFFDLVGEYIKDEDKVGFLLEKMSERLRRLPHTVLRENIINVSGAENFFRKKTKEFLNSKDLATFDAGLLILESFEGKDFEKDIGIENLQAIILEKIFQDEDLFLAKDSARYLSKNHPKFLTENAAKVFDARTDRDIRIFVLKSIEKTSEIERVDDVGLEIIGKIISMDDDAQVRKEAFILSEKIKSIPDNMKEVLKASVDDYNAHKSNWIKFNGNSKALLDDLISTMKSKSHSCHECIAKECY
ncbi:hypothetical protein FO519_003229 [Halicephalobus sp. NKZ332]|nr:hypothetical protein FO519_003229 [Halicephalobus sp. NKZ332]